MHATPAFAPLPDSELMLKYYEVHDQAGCASCGAPATSGLTPADKAALLKSQGLVAAGIFHRNFNWLCHDFFRYRVYLKQEPQVLAVITIYNSLRTACRPATRYDPRQASFHTWLKSIARRVRLSHTIWRAAPDAVVLQQLAEVVRQLRDAKDKETHERLRKTAERLRKDLDGRYRDILTNWFRLYAEDCGCGTLPGELKPLVDETLNRVFNKAGTFDPEALAFIHWLSGIASDVLAWNAIRPAIKPPMVPEYLSREQIAIDEQVRDTEDPPDARMMMDELTNPAFVACWKKLNALEQKVVWMIDVLKYTPQQTAGVLGRTLGTVRNNHASGLKKLKHALGLLGYAAPEDPDSEMIAKYRAVPGMLREQLDSRYGDLLIDWFRRRLLDAGQTCQPAHLVNLVNETFQRVIAEVHNFKPTETNFIVWLGRMARTVLEEL